MLQLLPSLCLLAAFAIIGIGDSVRHLVGRVNRNRDGRIVFAVAVAVSSAALLVAPFAYLVPVVDDPTSAMPQQSVILKAVNTFYGNYSAVPQNCLVFTFTPDIWVEANRSAAQIGYINGANATLQQSFSDYSCKVFDYGYWCVVPPSHTTTCSYIISHYQLTNLGPKNATLGGDSVAFYQIDNYS